MLNACVQWILSLWGNSKLDNDYLLPSLSTQTLAHS